MFQHFWGRLCWLKFKPGLDDGWRVVDVVGETPGMRYVHEQSVVFKFAGLPVTYPQNNPAFDWTCELWV